MSARVDIGSHETFLLTCRNSYPTLFLSFSRIMSGFTLTPVIVVGSAGLTTLSQRLTFSLRFFKGLAKTLYVLPVLIRVLPIFPDLTF